MVTPWLGVLGRGEFRDAFVWLGDPDAPEGANRAYLTKSWRGTGGRPGGVQRAHRAEGRVPAQRRIRRHPRDRNDVFTSSLVFIELRGEHRRRASEQCAMAGLLRLALGRRDLAAASAPPRPSSADRPGRPGPSSSALQNEVREQRQMIIQLMQTEQQRYDMLLRLLQNGAASLQRRGSAAPGAAAAGQPRRRQARRADRAAATRPSRARSTAAPASSRAR